MACLLVIQIDIQAVCLYYFQRISTQYVLQSNCSAWYASFIFQVADGLTVETVGNIYNTQWDKKFLKSHSNTYISTYLGFLKIFLNVWFFSKFQLRSNKKFDNSKAIRKALIQLWRILVRPFLNRTNLLAEYWWIAFNICSKQFHKIYSIDMGNNLRIFFQNKTF